MALRSAVILGSCATIAFAAENAHEWAGVFAVADTKHTWSMQKVNGKYADPSMKLVAIPTSTPTKAGLEAEEDKGATLMKGNCPDAAAGSTLTIAAEGSCFNLVVGSSDTSLYHMDTTGLSGVVFFAQHVPTEFENNRHYFYD